MKNAMKIKIKRIILFVVFAILCGQKVCGQTTEGTEFWVTFMDNFSMPPSDSILTLKLIASSRRDATITVANPQTGYNKNFSVKANEVAEFVVPHEEGYTFYSGSAQKRGLRVTSTTPVSLYASNFYEYTYDATIVLPIMALGTDYVTQIYENNLMAKELAVVATQNNTTVTITPHARTSDGKVKNVPFSLTLNAGETYLLLSTDEGSDFSGTRVQSNSPVAVYSGHQCINVPTGNKWCDHIVEQQLPTLFWGKQFALTKTKGQNGDMVMITARDDNTEVLVNGTKQTTLQAMQSYEFRLTDNSAFVETSGPAACYLYLEGAQRNNMTGDPASVHISPVEQKVKQITFATFQTSVSKTHYVNVVTTVSGASGMMLDGKSVADKFSPLTGNKSLRFAQIRIPHGTHTLQTTKDGFTGHVYGVGYCESYAYTMGSATRELNGMILVDGQPHNGDDEEERCYKKPVTFSPQSDVEFNRIEWDFGDGQKSNQQTVTHTYASPGTYQVEMRISNSEGRDTARTTLRLVDTLRDTVRVSICEGETYPLGGKTFSTEGKYDVLLTSIGGCDSIVTLELSVHKTYTVHESATFRKGSSYRWHNHWFREEGVYHDTLPTIHGCDSIFVLTLTATDAVVEMTDTICWQPTYNFRGYDYVIPPIDEYADNEYVEYVLEHFDKKACEHYRMELAIIPKTSGIIELNENIQEGESYDFFGEQISVEGDYTKTIRYACNCEEVYTLHLSVYNFPVTKVSASLCHEDSYTFRGKPYTTPGVYFDTVFSMTGIDTVYEFTLSDSRSHTELSVQNVSSYVFNGKTLTESGTYTDVLTNQAGCDSIVTLHLGIGEKCTITEEENLSLCEGESIVWNGKTCVPGNDYTAALVSSGGCDSIVTLHLAKRAKVQTELSVEICEGDYYRVGEERFSEKGKYSVHLTGANGCDSIVLLELNYRQAWSDTTQATIHSGETFLWDGDTYSQKGIYSKGYVAANGCDSILVLNLSVLSPATHEDCDTLIAQITIPEVCADDPSLDLLLEIFKGRPTTYSLNFDAKSVAQGFQSRYDYVWDPGAAQADLSIPLPKDPADTMHYVLPDAYSFYIIFNDECGYTNVWEGLPFKVHYPSWLVLQRWNDVLSLRNEDYNGGYTFSSIRWYHEDMPVEGKGENGAYIYVPEGLVPGDAYWAELTRADDGVTMTTCPFYPVKITDETKLGAVIEPYVTVTPTVLSSSNMTMNVQTNICGTYFVYNSDGNQLCRKPFCPPSDDNIFTIDLSPYDTRSGMYMITFQGVEGTVITAKIIVEP